MRYLDTHGHPYDMNQLLDPHITLICAYISGDVYNEKAAPKHPFLTHWIRQEDYDGEKLLKDKDSGSYFNRMISMLDPIGSGTLASFFARRYSHNLFDTSIFAFRGTIGAANIPADLRIETRSWSMYDEAAIAFFRLMIDKYIKPSAPKAYWLTGHSLGGYLAQVVAAKYPTNTVAISFNSPGIGGLNRMDDIRYLKIRDRYPNIFNINTSQQDIVHYLGGKQVGQSYDFPRETDCSYRYVSRHPIDHGLCEHAIQTVLSQVEKYSPLEEKISQQADQVYEKQLDAVS